MSLYKKACEILEEIKKPKCELITLYRIDKVAGSVEQKWVENAITDLPTADGHSYLDAFAGTDAEGYPAHSNAADVVDQVNSTAATTNVSNAALDDQARSDFWLCLTADREISESTGSADAVGVWASESCGSYKMEQKLDAVYRNQVINPLGVYTRGLYRFRLYHHDVSFNGFARLVYRNAAGNLVAIPAAWVSQNKPTITPVLAWCCDDGTIWNKDKSEQLELSDTLLMEDLRCSGSDCLTCG